MINTLFLTPNEKRTIIGNCYNYVAKCLFPCSIRILDNFGNEVDRFDNITSGFCFKLTRSDLYKIEVTNGIYGQDIKIYSGMFEIKGVNEFEKSYETFTYSGAVSAEYSILQIRNLSQHAIKIYYNCNYSLFYHIYNYISDSYGTNSNSYFPSNCFDNELLTIPIEANHYGTLPTNKLKFKNKITGDFISHYNICLLPSNLSLIFTASDTGVSVNINFKIFI